jgi:hypothetical protein
MSLYIVKNNFKIIEANGRWDAYQMALNYTSAPILMRMKNKQQTKEYPYEDLSSLH